MHTAPIFSSTAPLPSAAGQEGRAVVSSLLRQQTAVWLPMLGSIPSLLARSAEERIGWARSHGTACGVAQVFVPAALPQLRPALQLNSWCAQGSRLERGLTGKARQHPWLDRCDPDSRFPSLAPR